MSLYKFLATPKSQNLAVQEWESTYQHTLPTHVGPNTRYNQRMDLQGTHPSLTFCIGKFWGDSSNVSMSLRFLSRFGRQCLAVSGVKRLPLRVFSWEMWAQTSRCINFHCFFWSDKTCVHSFLFGTNQNQQTQSWDHHCIPLGVCKVKLQDVLWRCMGTSGLVQVALQVRTNKTHLVRCREYHGNPWNTCIKTVGWRICR